MNAATVSGPASTASQSAGMAFRGDGLDRAHGARLEVQLVGDDEVRPQHQLVAGLGQQAARQLQLVVLDDRLADLQPLRLQERVRHAAADQQLVDAREQVLDDVDLARHLRPADDGDERPLRVPERLAQVVELLLHQEAGRRLRHEARDPLGRRVGAVRAAERVVHVDVRQRGELLGERGIVLFLGGVEAQVLEQEDAAGRERRRPPGSAGGPDAVVGEGDGRAEERRRARRRPGAGSCRGRACRRAARGATSG